MKFSELPGRIQKKILKAQKNEITESNVYFKMAETVKGRNNKILKVIGKDEKTHYSRWKKLTERDIRPSGLKVFFYTIVTRFFGLSFGLKLMEQGEKSAQTEYSEIIEFCPEIRDIIDDEDRHERTLLNMLDEEMLQYIGSIVLGLNDALVELTGALAGLTFALQRTKLIAVTAFITGIAASMSMAASEYLSTKAESTANSGSSLKNPLKASVYTGVAYVITILLLILPYLLFNNYFVCLAISLVTAIFIIFLFNYYISVAKELSFKARFFEMLLISIGIAVLSFGIGLLVRVFFHVDI